jgi:hypothetical protein
MSKISSDMIKNNNVVLSNKCHIINQFLDGKAKITFKNTGKGNEVELLKDGKVFKKFVNRSRLRDFLDGMYLMIEIELL